MVPPPNVDTCGQPSAATWADMYLSYVKNVKVFDCANSSVRLYHYCTIMDGHSKFVRRKHTDRPGS